MICYIQSLRKLCIFLAFLVSITKASISCNHTILATSPPHHGFHTSDSAASEISSEWVICARDRWLNG